MALCLSTLLLVCRFVLFIVVHDRVLVDRFNFLGKMRAWCCKPVTDKLDTVIEEVWFFLRFGTRFIAIGSKS